MSKGPAKPSPLQAVLADLALTHRHLVLVRGQDYFRVEDSAKQARRDAASGSPDVRRFLSMPVFWWETDPDGKVVVLQQTPEGPRVLAAEVGSKYISWTLDEGVRGPESLPFGSSLGFRDYLEAMPEPMILTLEGKRQKDPEYKNLREGFWRMIQRIHSGIPGFNGTGFVTSGQFTGGNAGVRTGWVLKPHGTMAMIDAVSVAGFYLFGATWPQMFAIMGLAGNFSKIISELEEEFGIASTRDLTRGTVPNPEA